MKFLYSNDDSNKGLFSSLMGSWIFWIVIFLIVILIFVYVLKSNKNIQQKLRVQKFFGNVKQLGNDEDNSNIEDTIRENLINEINYENNYHDNDEESLGDPIPDLNKFLGDDLDDDSEGKHLLLGLDGSDKNVHCVYKISPNKESVFKIADEQIEEVNFKILLRNSINKTNHDPGLVSELRIYNEDRNCIAVYTINMDSMRIRSISPFFDDVTLPINDPVRLFAFVQKSNKLFIDRKQVAMFNIYDKIKYFYIKSPLIKEIHYMCLDENPNKQEKTNPQ